MSIIQAENIMLTDPAHIRCDYDIEYDHGSAFINGKYCSIDDAAIPIADLGFMQADAAYDVVSTSKGFLFRLDEHLDRFEEACAKFLLRNPYTKDQTASILKNLVNLAGTKEAYVWWAVTRGYSPDPAQRTNPEAYQNFFYAFVIPYLFIANDDQRTRGMDIIVSKKFIRIPAEAVDPTAKNFHWMDLKMSLFEARDRGGEWSVLCTADNFLAEAPGSNIFVVKEGAIYTPATGCLEGITRKTTMELAQLAGVAIHVEPVHLDQLLNADEAFLTSTAGGIMPINSVDGRVLGGEAGPGKITTELHNLYWTKRWDGWLGTAVDYGATSKQ